MIRPAKPTDAPAMAEVLSRWIDATDWMPRMHTHAGDLGFCERLLTRQEVWVADTAKGFGFLARQGDEIDALYLSPALRRQGWGRALLQAVKTDRERLRLWTFQANTGAIAFYQAQDFHISDLTDGAGNDEKLPDARMIWERNRP